MIYKAVELNDKEWGVGRSGGGELLYCSTCTEDEARRIAALLNKSDGMATKDIEDALEDGGLGRVVAERERLRAALVACADDLEMYIEAEYAQFIHFDMTEKKKEAMGPVIQARAALANDA